jgi:hypothetical protein
MLLRGSRARNMLSTLVTALILTALVTGCADDVVCPGVGEPDIEAFVTARVVEAAGAPRDTTWVEVHATADTLPTLLFASVNDRQIDDVAVDELGLSVSLEDDAVIWQPGTICSLRVTTNYGFATSSEAVPSGSEVTAPDAITLGDSLALAWTSAVGADYYVVRAALGGNEITATVRDTAAIIEAVDIPVAGTMRGHVEAVAGPFPETGGGGNIDGAGWGFFRVAYHDSGSTFEVAVADTARR